MAKAFEGKETPEEEAMEMREMKRGGKRHKMRGGRKSKRASKR